MSLTFKYLHVLDNYEFYIDMCDNYSRLMNIKLQKKLVYACLSLSKPFFNGLLSIIFIRCQYLADKTLQTEFDIFGSVKPSYCSLHYSNQRYCLLTDRKFKIMSVQSYNLEMIWRYD